MEYVIVTVFILNAVGTKSCTRDWEIWVNDLGWDGGDCEPYKIPSHGQNCSCCASQSWTIFHWLCYDKMQINHKIPNGQCNSNFFTSRSLWTTNKTRGEGGVDNTGCDTSLCPQGVHA